MLRPTVTAAIGSAELNSSTLVSKGCSKIGRLEVFWPYKKG